MNDLLSPPFPREELKAAVATLAREGIYIGTSSWKYEGWLGQLYTPERYLTRGRLSRAKFEKTCLAEYAEVGCGSARHGHTRDRRKMRAAR